MLTMKAENISGIVLAGGFSRRMGTDKAELTLGGLTLLELQIRKLRQIGITDIMISGYGKPMEGTRAIEDIYPHKGPMSGIHACLKAAKSEACLVVSVDVPLFPAEWLDARAVPVPGDIAVYSLSGVGSDVDARGVGQANLKLVTTADPAVQRFFEVQYYVYGMKRSLTVRVN